MSNIDEIMGAVGRNGDDCIHDADAASESFDELREMIAAALAEAERKGAEAMRDAAADEAIRRGQSCGDRTNRDLVEAILALPLSERTVEVVMDREHGGLTFAPAKREPVLLTDEQIDGLIGRHWGDTGVAVQSVADFAARVQAAVIAANNLEVRRG